MCEDTKYYFYTSNLRVHHLCRTFKYVSQRLCVTYVSQCFLVLEKLVKMKRGDVIDVLQSVTFRYCNK